MGQWIKLCDEKPKDGQIVMIKSDKLWIGEATFKDGRFDFNWIKGSCFGEISHWLKND